MGETVILQPSSVEEALTLQGENRGLIWGAMGSDGELFWAHNGGDADVATMAAINPADQMGVIFFSNGNWRRSHAYGAIFGQLFALADTEVTE